MSHARHLRFRVRSPTRLGRRPALRGVPGLAQPHTLGLGAFSRLRQFPLRRRKRRQMLRRLLPVRSCGALGLRQPIP
jgi:hypothetical protein